MRADRPPMRMALASDIDGTLYFPDETPCVRAGDIRAIRRWQASGQLFGLCSGRAACSMHQGIGDAIRPDFYIASSGAALMDGQMRMLRVRSMDVQAIAAVMALCPEAGAFVAHTTHCVYRTRPSKNAWGPVRLFTSPGELAGEAITGVSLRFENREQARRARARVAALDGLTAFQNEATLDVVPAGCSKGEGLRAMCALLGVKTMAAIGDSYNDIPMLSEADMGFTFAASDEGVRAHADHIVQTLEEAIGMLEAAGMTDGRV